MPTPFQIEEQVNLEREAIAQGLNRLRSNLRELEDKNYASATTYGVTSIDTLLPLVIKYIEDTFQDRFNKGHKGR